MPQVDHASPSIDAVIVKGRLKDFNSHVLANIGWAFATARHASPVLFDATAKVARGRLKDLNSYACANTVGNFATVSHELPERGDTIARVAKRLFEGFQFSLPCESWLRIAKDC